VNSPVTRTVADRRRSRSRPSTAPQSPASDLRRAPAPVPVATTSPSPNCPGAIATNAAAERRSRGVARSSQCSRRSPRVARVRPAPPPHASTCSRSPVRMPSALGSSLCASSPPRATVLQLRLLDPHAVRRALTSHQRPSRRERRGSVAAANVHDGQRVAGDRRTRRDVPDHRARPAARRSSGVGRWPERSAGAASTRDGRRGSTTRPECLEAFPRCLHGTAPRCMQSLRTARIAVSVR